MRSGSSIRKVVEAIAAGAEMSTSEIVTFTDDGLLVAVADGPREADVIRLCEQLASFGYLKVLPSPKKVVAYELA